MSKIKIVVMSKKDLIDKVNKNTNLNDYNLISIYDPFTIKPFKLFDSNLRRPKNFKKTFKNILKLRFFDSDYKVNRKNIIPKRIPKVKDIKKIVEFFNKTKDETKGYIVHCNNAISRSTAVALILFYLIYKDESLAANELIKIRKGAIPNKIILKLFDGFYGSNLSATRNYIIKRSFNKSSLSPSCRTFG